MHIILFQIYKNIYFIDETTKKNIFLLIDVVRIFIVYSLHQKILYSCFVVAK